MTTQQKAKHTPGPWYFCYGEVWTTPDGPEDGGKCIARRHSDALLMPTEKDANLQLCASAPDLLAALEALLAYEDDQPEPDTFGATVYAQAQAAIRKAKGE